MNDIAPSSELSPPRPVPLTAIVPQVAIVFLGMASVGIPLPVLGAFVHGTLGFDAVMVGLVVGCQAFATVATRGLAGTLCDRFGPKRAMLTGLPAASLASLLYLAALWLPAPPLIRLLVLFAGRLLLGFAESLFLTGTMTWGITKLGPARTGKVMAWQGIALYAAFAAGAPVGVAVMAYSGFAAVSLVMMAASLLAMGIALLLPEVAFAPGKRGKEGSFVRVLGLVWRPGITLALATVPVGAMSAFVALDFDAHGWARAGLAFTGFGLGFIVVRLLFGHMPDRFGGRVVALVSLPVLVAGQILTWLAPSEVVALAGTTVTGLGFSLIFPAMGVAAVQTASPAIRGMAVAAYVAFFDIANGVSGPVCGLAAGFAGYASVFLVGAVASAGALALVLLAQKPAKGSGNSIPS
jgi:MFS family permease